ncbi:MAG: JAB domain-containing protein [Vicingaceae bacterium]
MKSLSQNIQFKKSFHILHEIEISYKSKTKLSDRVKLTSSQNVYQCLMDIWNPDTIELHERFYVIYLDRANHVLGCIQHSIGGIAGTVADVRLILATALKARATSLILAHNHPSGRLIPSQADRKLTEKVKDGAALLDLSLLDHLIVTSEGYYSFADEGLL